MKLFKDLKIIYKIVNPNVLFLEYGIIFVSVSLIGIQNGNFLSWWGSSLDYKSSFLLSSLLLIFGIFYICLFIFWWRKLPIKKLKYKKIINNIIIFWLILVFLYLMRYYRIIKIPFYIMLPIIIIYIVYSDTNLERINSLFDEASLNKQNNFKKE